MTNKKITVSEAELEIMKVLWERSGAVDTRTINNALQHMQWKRTTISTLLTRLVEKGAVSSEKKGSSYLYTPLISKKEYRKTQTKNFIQKLYSGSVKELAVALFEDDILSEDDIKELKEFFEQ